MALNQEFTLWEEQEAIRLYTEEHMGCRKIAERFGRSKDKILELLKYLGVEIRGSGGIKIPDDERFSNYVQKTGSCWNWTGGKTPFGHGRFGLSKEKWVFAHRYAWEQVNGRIPTGLQVLHKCDNPQCVNPSHLFLGTQADNMLDMKAKGRGRGGTQKGSKNPNSVLTEGQVEEIRDRFQSGEKAKALWEEYEISKSQFYRIVNDENWSS